MTEVAIALPGCVTEDLQDYFALPTSEDAATRPTCWYFGDNYERLATWRRVCGDSFEFAAVGEALNRVASMIEEEFIDLDQQLVRGRLSRLLWDASALGERNPYQSDLLVNVCRYRVFLDAIASPGRHLFVVDDVGFARLLDRAASGRGIAVKWLPKSTVGTIAVARRLYGLLRAAVGAAGDLKARWCSVRCHRVFRAKTPVPCERLRDIDVLLVTWAGPRSFAALAEERMDAYWGELPSMLAEQGLKVGHLANPLSWIHPYDEILEGATHASEPVLFVDDCVGWFDRVLAAVLPAVFARACGARMELGGADLSPVLEVEIAKEPSKGHIRSSLRFRAIGRWLARKGIHPRVILYPYEGQSWEKMLCRGVRRHLAATRIGACQHAPFAPGYLSFFPSRKDIADGHIPDVLGVIGEWYGQCLASRGLPIERIAILGSLRLEYLATAANVAAPDSESTGGWTVLCCCSIGFAESAELAVKTACAIADDPDATLVINFHPVTGRRFREQVQRCVEEDSSLPGSRITYSGRSARELVAEADVLVYNSSGAAFDALARGVPVVFVGCDTTLDFNKVPSLLCHEARSVDELKRRLGSIVGDGASRRRTVAPQLRAYFSEPQVRPLLAALDPRLLCAG